MYSGMQGWSVCTTFGCGHPHVMEEVQRIERIIRIFFEAQWGRHAKDILFFV